MDKKKFCKIITELQAGNALQCKVAAAIRQFNNIVSSDFPEPYGMVISHEHLCQELFSEIMDDQYDDIGYFCNELDYGKLYEKGMVCDANGCDVDLSTSEKLYDFLVYQKNSRDKNESN